MIPEKGTLWKHPKLRGSWRVAIVGRKWITLSPTLAILGPTQCDKDTWPMHIGGEWVRAF